jgi:flagellar hook-length control protein FliK
MTVAASRPPLLVAAPAPLPTPADREPVPGAAAHPFAEMLRQNRLADRTPAEVPRALAAAEAPKVEANARDGVDRDEPALATDASPKSEAGRARARSGAASRNTARPTAPAERSGRASEEVAAHDAKKDNGAPADAVATTPSGEARPEAQPLTDAQPRGFAAAQAQQAADAAGRDHLAAEFANPADSGRNPAGGNDAKVRRFGGDSTEPAAGRTAARAKAEAAQAPAASFAQALEETKSQDRAARVALDRPSLAANPAAGTHEPLQQAAPDSEAAALAANLPVPVDSPEFASALGVQVSVFVREGVQHAELHLNPVETGPVSIAITLEGTQAHVEFGADLAATRQAIENGLPELASALRDAGFTLAGGGVSQHARSGGGQGSDDPAGRAGQRRGEARTSDALEATVQRATQRIAAGGVDLYA